MLFLLHAYGCQLSEAYEWCKIQLFLCRRTGVSCQRRMSGATSTGTAAKRLSCTRPGTSITTSSSASTSSCPASPSWRCSTWLQPSSEPRSSPVPTSSSCSSSGLLLLLPCLHLLLLLLLLPCFFCMPDRPGGAVRGSSPSCFFSSPLPSPLSTAYCNLYCLLSCPTPFACLSIWVLHLPDRA